jgi:uncharacterized protein YcbK (DUF882 family)
MSIITWRKGKGHQVSNHFHLAEFECPCKKCDQELQYIDQELVAKLEKTRATYGSALKVNSGYRCPAHNKEVGGAADSAHVKGLAADITPLRKTLDDLDSLYEICYNEFSNIGDGRNLTFIHVDVRPAKPTGKRHWVY